MALGFGAGGATPLPDNDYTTRAMSKAKLDAATRAAQSNIGRDEAEKQRLAQQSVAEGLRAQQAVPVTPTPGQLSTLQAGNVGLPSIFATADPAAGLVAPAQGIPQAPQPSIQAQQPPMGGIPGSPAWQTVTQSQMSNTGEGMREMTPEEIKAQEQIKKRLELEAAGLPTQKEQLQAQTVAEAKARIGVKAVLKSIEQETGMKPGDVGKQIGWEAGDGMTAKEALRKVNAFQKSRTMAKANDKRAARDIDEITQKAQRNEEGIAENDAARFQDIDSALDSVGADPLSEDPLRKSMTQSQSKEYDRLRSKVAGDRARDNDFKRMDKFVKDIQRKDQQKYARKQAKEVENVKSKAYAKAQSADDKAWLDSNLKELAAIEKRIKRYDDATTDEEKAEIMPAEQYGEYQNRKGEIIGSVGNFNKTGSRGDTPAQPQGAGNKSPQELVNEVKLENPNWTPQQIAAEARKRAGA